MLLDNLSKQIHEAAVDKASNYLIAEAELLSAIIEVDRHRLYEKFDEPYLTPYCVKYLNLSEDVAAMFVRVARKSMQVPELQFAVQEGLQMSKAKAIASVVTAENKDQWIEKAQSLSKEKLEREVAAANPSAPKLEKAKPTGPDRVRIEFEVTFEEAELLKRARELMSQKKSAQAQIGETFVTALKDWVDREDPVCKAERAQARKEKKQNIIESDRSRDRSRDSRSTDVFHRVTLRDRGACHKRMPDGSNCGSRRWTDIHHIVPRAFGGTDTVENLITLCRAHHRQLHRRSGDSGHMKRFSASMAPSSCPPH